MPMQSTSISSHGQYSHYSHLEQMGLKVTTRKVPLVVRLSNLAVTCCRTVPELPDIVVYIEALEKRILGQTLEHVRIASPFLLGTAEPPIASVEGKRIKELRRIGKRICIGLENDLWLVLHLMIAGRLHWKKRSVKVSPPRGLAAFDFTNGSLLWTETGEDFPEKVTAFRPGMAVHGRYKEPCLRCGEKIQRIRYASNETNYCPHCQTAGKLLADRSLSRLLRSDWPRTPDELELLTR